MVSYTLSGQTNCPFSEFSDPKKTLGILTELLQNRLRMSAYVPRKWTQQHNCLGCKSYLIALVDKDAESLTVKLNKFRLHYVLPRQ